MLGFTVPWAVAWHCRSKMCGAAAPATSAAKARESAAHRRPSKEGMGGVGEGHDGERGLPMVGKGPLRQR